MKAETSEDEKRLRATIVRRERELEQALAELVGAAEARASLSHYVSRYPWHFLAGGMLLGFWLGRR